MRMLCEQHDDTRCHDLTRCQISDGVIGCCCDGTDDREVPQIKIYCATQFEFHGIERRNYNFRQFESQSLI